ncbi:MAG: hypothetical protein ACYTXA_33220 [Nostoc sp.]
MSRLKYCIRRRLGGAERNPTDYQDVGLRKASTQPTIFFQLGMEAGTDDGSCSKHRFVNGA